MKILRVINSLEIGGAERSIASNTLLHAKNGLDIEVLLLNGTNTFFLKELRDNGIKVAYLMKDKNIYNPFLVFKICKIINKYDIVHGHLFPTLYWLALAKFIIRSKTKLVYTEHSTYNRRRDNYLFKRLDKFIYKQYDLVITISNAANEKLREYLGNNFNTIVINNGVDLSKLVNESMMKREDLIEKIGHLKVILQISAFRKEKDQDTLIKALSYLPNDFCVVFVGDGERKIICEQYTKKLGLSDRVFFLGIQDHIGAIISLANVVVMSSHWEGFGRAAVEGMALGKPVISTNVPGLSEVVLDAGLLFAVGDYKELAELILNLITNQQYYSEISSKCLKRAEKYNIEIMVQKYETVYKNLLNNKL
ncbi:MAG: glycosyltransferase [Ignavibacteriae bacterium]|nr:glycosyltransferase [Ignavibacteriota bacterium]